MSLKRYAHLASAALSDQGWALHPDMARVIASIVAERICLGMPADAAAVEAALVARKNLPQPTRGGVGIIPIYGVTSARQNLLAESSGGTSCELVIKQARAFARDPNVKTIVLDIDSPGGTVAGTTEVATVLREIRATKPIIAHANMQATSAAYWIASSATKIHASPSGLLGSIGVLSIHHDVSEMLQKAGVKRTLMGAGKYKLEGFDGEPLSEEASARRAAMLATSYDRFVGDVAKGRGVTVSVVRAGYGEGRCLSAEEALDAGMIDSVATFEETIERLLPAGTAFDSALDSRPADTAQEPDRLTAQDRRDVPWRSSIERTFFEWSLTS